MKYICSLTLYKFYIIFGYKFLFFRSVISQDFSWFPDFFFLVFFKQTSIFLKISWKRSSHQGKREVATKEKKK